MTLKAEQAEAALIQSLCSRLPDRIAPELVEQCEAFVRQFYHWVPPEDLAGRSTRDLYGAAMAVWDFARDRARGSASVRAYNPGIEAHGWQSTNTIVEVVTDDMPFLVDSVSMELSRLGYGIQLSIVPIMDVLRDEHGVIAEVFPPGAGMTNALTESLMQFEVDRETEPERLEALVGGIRSVLGDVRAAVEDWPLMRRRMHEIVAGFESVPPSLHRSDVTEVNAFLEWVDRGNFIFLGYCEYDLVTEAGEDALRAVDGSGLGVLRHGSAIAPMSFPRIPAEIRSTTRAPQPLILTKADSRSTVHRPLYLDYLGVKRFEAGEVCGERRFLGLYTTAAEQASPRTIPILRDKVERVTRRAAYPPESHNAKALAKTLDNYPRDELFQITDDELFAISMGIVALGERQRVRLFARRDPYKRFVSCLVFVPRDRFNTDNRERIASVLGEAFGASEIDWAVRPSDSMLTRIHYIVHCSAADVDHDLTQVERRIAEVTRPWAGDLADALREVHGEARGNALFRRYRAAFPIAYRADWAARSAVADIDRAESLRGSGVVMSVYQTVEADRSSLRCKLLSPGERIALSDVLPILENMGLRVGDERPYEIKPEGGPTTWMYDIGVVCEFDVELGTEAMRTAFQDAFARVWSGEFENDRLGALVLRAGLTGREVSMLRAVVKYLRQVGATFSDRYLQQALIGNPTVARQLVGLFGVRLDPDRHALAAADRLGDEVERAIEDMASVDEARILRDCLAVVRAIVRTNYFQRSPAGLPRPQLSFKLDPSLMPFLPFPRPRFEIFVYSPRVEGVYLRGGRVARGGIRWSDRREGFRTEVLGLMKAETVKNAVIVPVGAKGGFVTKRPPSACGAGALLEDVADCYRLFVSGLLDLTDNVMGAEVVAPPAVIRHDEEDVYLVVAAEEEETASLSELATGIAAEYGFWLGDSFAAGGSLGYDHKQMGITARGAWESARRHFRGFGVDLQSEEFTVVGIGDMSGDVFGNGMLRSPHIRLVAAFSHDDVFLDPNPDPQASFAERRRLFGLPASSWRDYDSAAISAGGGVFSRSDQRIALSVQVREVLDIEAEALTPDELIRALLRAPVDLIWSAGVGTFIKARSESNADVRDKANDGVRIDGRELRCRAVVEGGSLGFTQEGRIEYALAGGRINTDAVDNVAGINCSDHEVNLKILLDDVLAAGEITSSQRTELLGTLTEAIANRVLSESYAQALALSLEGRQASSLLDLHARLIDHLARRGLLDRRLQELPRDERIRERKAANKGLTSPELSVLFAYTKIDLCIDLLESDLPDDEYLRNELAGSLPASLRERFRRHMRQHRLRREIVTADLANGIVDRAGTTFVSRLAEETGASTEQIARAFAVAVTVFEMRGFWREVEALDDVVDEQAQFKMLLQGRRLVTRAARWLIRNRQLPLDISPAVADYAPGAATLREALPELLSALDGDAWHARVAESADAGVPTALASRVAAMDAEFFALDVVESVRGTDASVRRAAAVHFGLDRRLELAWLRNRILELPRADIWRTLARSALRDDLYTTHRALTTAVLQASSPSLERDAAIDEWFESSAARVRRYLVTLADVRTASANDFTTLLVAVRALANLISSNSS